MQCRDIVDLLSDLLDSQLEQETMAKIEAHLAQCSACAAALEELKSTIALVKGLPRLTAPANLASDIEIAIAEERKREIKAKNMKKKQFLSALSLAACLLLSLILWRGTNAKETAATALAKKPTKTVAQKADRPAKKAMYDEDIEKALNNLDKKKGKKFAGQVARVEPEDGKSAKEEKILKKPRVKDIRESAKMENKAFEKQKKKAKIKKQIAVKIASSKENKGFANKEKKRAERRRLNKKKDNLKQSFKDTSPKIHRDQNNFSESKKEAEKKEMVEQEQEEEDNEDANRDKGLDREGANDDDAEAGDYSTSEDETKDADDWTGKNRRARMARAGVAKANGNGAKQDSIRVGKTKRQDNPLQNAPKKETVAMKRKSKNPKPTLSLTKWYQKLSKQISKEKPMAFSLQTKNFDITLRIVSSKALELSSKLQKIYGKAPQLVNYFLPPKEIIYVHYWKQVVSQEQQRKLWQLFPRESQQKSPQEKNSLEENKSRKKHTITTTLTALPQDVSLKQIKGSNTKK